MAKLFKKYRSKIRLKNNESLMMIKEGIRGGICHPIDRYVNANSKYVKNSNKDIESSYFIYLDANNLHG